MRINTLKTLKQVIGGNGELFVRWSRGIAMDSKQGNSRDYLAGGAHEGLSAVPVDAEWASDEVWMARRVTEYRFLKMKDSKIGCHIYRAQRVGTDSDGYALIASAQLVGSLSAKLIDQLVELKGV